MWESRYYALLVLQLFFIFPSLSAEGRLKFTKSPDPIVAPIGDKVVFECSVDTPTDKILWLHNGARLQYSEPPKKQITTDRLIVSFNDQAKEGDYQCVAVFGAASIVSRPAQLTIASMQPFFYQPRKQFEVTEGNTVAINCPPPKSNPPAIIQYTKDGNVLMDRRSILQTTDSLLLTNITSKDSGVYSCQANNYIKGNVIQAPMNITLTVIPPREKLAPTFLQTPPKTYSILTGQNVSLECTGVGNPPPTVTWRRTGGSGVLPPNRTINTVGALKIINVQPSDQGQYLCELSNDVPPKKAHIVTLDVQVPPNITVGPKSDVVNEEDTTSLSCEVTGSPPPKVTWFLNAVPITNDSHITQQGNKITIKNIEKTHAGIYQCFATNVAGVVYEYAVLQVSPKLVTEQEPMENEEQEGVPVVPPNTARGRGKKNHTRKGKGRRKDKKHKGPPMVPPSKPEVTRLSDTSVMVRWSVPENIGLPIRFFKVQYQDLDKKKSDWLTSNEDIHSHIRSYEVNNLVTEHHYRFRIGAVYINNDNQVSRKSAKFFLRRGNGNAKTPLTPPQLVHSEAVSPTAIQIEWEYLNSMLAPVDGFYVYYRETTSAGEYLKATVEGDKARSYVITHLLPDSAYDIKVQSFTVGAASDFSRILTHKTQKAPNATPSTPLPEVIGVSSLSSGTAKSHGQLYLVLGAVIAGLTLLLSLAIAICICYKRSTPHDDGDGVEGCDKSRGVEQGLTIQQLEPVTMNGFLHNGKVNGRVTNGFVPRAMNITNNPLADSEQDKVSRQRRDASMPPSSSSFTNGSPPHGSSLWTNVMEMSYMTNQNNNCSSTEGRSALDEELEMDTSKRRGSWRSTRVSRTGENYV